MYSFPPEAVISSGFYSVIHYHVDGGFDHQDSYIISLQWTVLLSPVTLQTVISMSVMFLLWTRGNQADGQVLTSADFGKVEKVEEMQVEKWVMNLGTRETESWGPWGCRSEGAQGAFRLRGKETGKQEFRCDGEAWSAAGWEGSAISCCAQSQAWAPCLFSRWEQQEKFLCAST